MRRALVALLLTASALGLTACATEPAPVPAKYGVFESTVGMTPDVARHRVESETNGYTVSFITKDGAPVSEPIFDFYTYHVIAYLLYRDGDVTLVIERDTEDGTQGLR